MDPIRLIKEDHRTVEDLFRRFENADRRGEKQKLGQEIIEELSVHAVIEEQLIYPLLRGFGGNWGSGGNIVVNSSEAANALAWYVNALGQYAPPAVRN